MEAGTEPAKVSKLSVGSSRDPKEPMGAQQWDDDIHWAQVCLSVKEWKKQHNKQQQISNFQVAMLMRPGI